MNAFELRGEVLSTEKRNTQKGSVFFLVRLDTGTAQVTVPIFRLPTGGPLEPGERIRVEGSLAENANGYLQLRNVECGREKYATGAANARPKNNGTPRIPADSPGPRGAQKAPPLPVGVGADDDLPF